LTILLTTLSLGQVTLLRSISVAALLATVTACSADEASMPEGTDDGAAQTTTSLIVLADDIPVASTPPGGYGDEMPPPILADCTEPLVAGAPDLRGLWRTVDVEVGGAPAPAEHGAHQHVERIEQCGDRLVVTAGGVIHDMRCDGTEENGVNDVAAADFTTPIAVVATYEDGVHTLRPVDLPIEVTRRLDGDQLVWTYPTFTARLERIGPPDAVSPPA
jgi:hypothetical protein